MTASLPGHHEGLSPLAGALAHNLAMLMPGMLEQVCFRLRCGGRRCVYRLGAGGHWTDPTGGLP